jgi:membrane-bound ClpP family serine protease
MIRPNMSWSVLRVALAATLLVFGAFAQTGPEPADAEPEPVALPEEAQARTAAPGSLVYVIPVEGDVGPVLAMVMNRAIRQATREDVAAIVFHMDTFGGRLDSAIKIRDRLVTLDVPTITFVDNKAISAGSLIALATDKIVMGRARTSGGPCRSRCSRKGPRGRTGSSSPLWRAR